jgi:hypothetical protein
MVTETEPETQTKTEAERHTCTGTETEAERETETARAAETETGAETQTGDRDTERQTYSRKSKAAAQSVEHVAAHGAEAAHRATHVASRRLHLLVLRPSEVLPVAKGRWVAGAAAAQATLRNLGGGDADRKSSGARGDGAGVSLAVRH